MRVRMTVDLSGTRNGVPWPPRGTVVDLPDDEAVSYCDAGMAVPAGNEPAETATVDVEEQRKPLTTSTGPRRKRS